MDFTKIKQLIDLLEKSDLNKMVIKEKNGFEVHLEKSQGVAPPVVYQSPHAEPSAKKESGLHHSEKPQKEEAKGAFIPSPMVGTFYRSSSPSAKPFVSVGDTVKEDTVVCIIEAMKVMNEVKSGKSGVIQEILLSDAAPVEFGTHLMRIE